MTLCHRPTLDAEGVSSRIVAPNCISVARTRIYACNGHDGDVPPLQRWLNLLSSLGDGILTRFSSVSQAIAAALVCSAASDAQGLRLHLGLHAGDLIREADNVFGGAVNIAARISGLSAPGEVLVSRTVADLARTSAGVTFEDRGEHALKGIGEPVRLYAVRGQA